MLRSPGPVLTISEVDYYNNGTWVQVMNGQPSDYPTQPTFFAYLPSGLIRFNLLRMDGYQNIRVTYTYGYNTVPTVINELSALLAGLQVLVYLSGSIYQDFSLGELKVDYSPEGQYGKQIEYINKRIAELKWQITTRKLMASSG